MFTYEFAVSFTSRDGVTVSVVEFVDDVSALAGINLRETATDQALMRIHDAGIWFRDWDADVEVRSVRGGVAV